jgi:nicotinamide mononucleotide transporter
MILMAKGRIECWIYWTVINVISIGLYVYKGVLFVAVLFGVYLVLAVMGFKNWQRLQVSKVNHGT